jgi:hypothetical protein
VRKVSILQKFEHASLFSDLGKMTKGINVNDIIKDRSPVFDYVITGLLPELIIPRVPAVLARSVSLYLRSKLKIAESVKW